jgi:two-component system, NtrC family, response regulator AtoC
MLINGKEDIMSPSPQTFHKSSGEQEAMWAERNASGRDRNSAAQATSGVTTLRPHLTTPLVGCSPVMKHLFTIIERVAPTSSSVFITGATGTGKELVARSIHAQSPRRKAPFVDINCSAIPETLLETEMFGHQRGTFTGAHENRRGLIESASGGTLFLDEVDALPLSAQVKLLRVLQERSLRRVGGRENIPVDVRIISATNRDLQRAVAEGTFRADLLFRLRVVPIRVPDLRERGDEDIRLLVDYFLRHRAEHDGRRPRSFSAAAMRALMACCWPGNVRELENTVEYALAIGSGDELGLDDLPPDVLQGDTGNCDMLRECMRHGETLAELERRYILSVLERCGGHQLNTAAVLGIDRRTLYRKLKEYGVTANSHAGAVRVLAEIPRLAGEEVSHFRKFDESSVRGSERAA